MKKYAWEIILGIGLLILSAALYLVQIRIFNSPRDTFFYLFQDLAFLPFQIFLVTIVLNQLIIIREKMQRLKKLNMIVGVFFSQLGTELLKRLAGFDDRIEELQERLKINTGWSGKDFFQIREFLSRRAYGIKLSTDKLESLKGLLANERMFMANLLGNPSLLEHERFTEVLWSVSHLTDELSARPVLAQSGPKDLEHLANDVKRVYGLIVNEWINYLEHLNIHYPYLFSLSIRNNPFNLEASVQVNN